MKSLRLILILMVVLALAGCSSGDSSTLTPPPSTGIDPDNLPLDPGEEGMRTVEGIDTNENGVRDDVERAIHERHPNAAANVMSALMQNAKALQAVVVAGDSGGEGAREVALMMEDAAADCLDLRMSNSASTESHFIRYQTLNTRDRSRAYNAFNVAFAGQTFNTDPINSPCE